MKTVALAGLFALGLSVAADAQHFATGNDLISWCEEDRQGRIDPGCSAYIAGVVDGATNAASTSSFMAAIMIHNFDGPQINQSATADTFRGFCLNPSVTSGQLRRVVTSYLLDNPAELDQAAPQLIKNILSESFPCP